MAGQPNLANGGAAWRRQQLLDKFLAGEIDRPMYDSLLAELQQWGESSASAPVSVKPSAELASSSDGEEPRVSVTKTRPGLPSNPASQPSALPEPGDELGGFRLEKRLGRGGMGEVWKASDLVGERTVVLKLLKGEKGKRKGKSGQKGVKKGSKRGQKGVKKGSKRGQKGGRKGAERGH